MRNLVSLVLLLFLAVPALAQSGAVTLDRFTVNQSAVLNSFQSPSYLYGNVEFSFGQAVTLVEVTVQIRDGDGNPVDGAAVSKQWASASANQELEFDYTYYNPSAIQEFKPVLIVTAKGANGNHIHSVFQPKGESGGGDGIGY
ncbi:MAG: hypothetical protein KC800_32110 [Candidatus Eremiobacteraeota bacterium]|nr:hypothetical protein [Candidatus Eremiobacteraeota bacterium]